jgi:hypothetical protein
MANVTIPQPGVPFVKIWIDGNEITAAPKRRLKRFVYSLGTTPSQANAITMELIDAEWTEVEQLLANSSGVITFRYGWLGETDKKLWSEEDTMMRILKFKPTLYDSYVSMTLEGFSLSKIIASDKTATTTSDFQASKVLEGTSVSKILKKIYSDKGFDVSNIEETAEFAKVHCSTDSTLSQTPTFIITGESAIQLYNNDFRYRAVKPGENKIGEQIKGRTEGTTNKGKGGYILYFKDTNPPQVYLTLGADIKEDRFMGSYDWPIVTSETREVISFDYEINIPMAGSTQGQGSTRTTLVDPTSSEQYTLKATEENHEEFPGPTPKQNKSSTVVPGLTSAHRIIQLSGNYSRSPKEARDALNATYDYKALQVRRSKLTLMGRPDFFLGHQVEMNVWAYVKYGEGQFEKTRHWSSGLWEALEVIHTIEPGKFTTVLDLIKLKDYKNTGVEGQVSKGSQEKFSLGDPTLPNESNYKLNFDESISA